MKNFLYNLYLNKFIIPRYTKNSQIFGNMLSYAYMGEPIGFEKFEKRNLKYAQILIKNNIKPWDYNEMAGVGWGHALPKLAMFNSEFEKEEWLKENLVDRLITKEVQKNNFASEIMSIIK